MRCSRVPNWNCTLMFIFIIYTNTATASQPYSIKPAHFPRNITQTTNYTRWPFPPISASKLFPAEALWPNHQWGRLAPSLLSNYGLPPDNTPRIQIRIGESGRRPRADQSVTAPGIDMWSRSSHAILNRFPRAIFVNRTPFWLGCDLWESDV